MKKYNLKDIAIKLEEIDICPGDTILMHSSLVSLGKLENARLTADTINKIISLILDFIGNEGTLIAPAFNYRFCKGEPFDHQNTPSENMGILSEAIRNWKTAKRSPHPMQSIAVIGKYADELTRLDPIAAFSTEGPFKKLLDLDAKLLLLGATMQAASFIHYVEERNQVPYRYWKSFSGKYIDKEIEQEKEYKLFVRSLKMSPQLDLLILADKMLELGKLRQADLGAGKISACSLADFYSVASDMLEINPLALLKNKDEVELLLRNADGNSKQDGEEIYQLVCKLFPICRSLTGNGVRKTLNILNDELEGALQVHEVSSGTQAFDWTVPQEWNITDAWIKDERGKKIVDFQESNLHVVGYSTPVDKKISLEELDKNLYSLPEQPNAIPYITSYYKKRWGFCLSHEQRQSLIEGTYQVFIDSELKDGSLTYGELILPGEKDQEVFLSTYICHPSMANNELSGPCVTTFIAKWLQQLKNRKYTYRIIFIPETIGSIVYLSRNLELLQKKVIAGFNINCIGDDRAYSYLPSRFGNTLADKTAKHVLKNLHPEYVEYSFLDRGSDERQYCSPNVDLPVVSIMRTKYGAYPEYHTSLDNLELVTPSGLFGGFEVLQKCIECIEMNEKLQVTVKCEPQLGKRGLYPNLSTKDVKSKVANMMNLLAYSDGKLTLLEIAEKIKVPMWDLLPVAKTFKEEKLLEEIY